MTEEQAGFRRDRSTTQHLLALRLIGEKARRKNIKMWRTGHKYRLKDIN